MKKLMIAMLVLVAACVYAQEQVSQDVQTALENVKFNPETGTFTILKGGTWSIQLDQKWTDNGNTDKFGYYKYVNGVVVGSEDLSSKPKGNDRFEISGLNAGDEIAFFVDPKNNGNSSGAVLNENGELAGKFVVMNAPQGTDMNSFTATADTVYGIAWPTQNNLSFKYYSFVVTDDTPAASGQPLPGALTTMLIAGGCAAFLRKRKAARK